MMSGTSLPLVSVVIPTWNSGGTIETALRSLSKQSYPNFETIVVDRGSSDNTVEIAVRHGASAYVIDADERCGQKNFGVGKAKGKYIYIADSDFLFEPAIIEEAVEKCETGGYDAIRIHNTSDPRMSYWSRVRMLERDCYVDDDLNVSARFVRRDVYLSIGGYDENLVAAEDYDLQNRLTKAGYRVGTINSREVHIGEPKTLGEIARKHYYYGRTLPRFVRKNRRIAVIQLSPVRLAFIRHWRSFAKRPLITAGFIMYQTTKYGFGAFGYLVGRLKR